jgi:hypothetical protein
MSFGVLISTNPEGEGEGEEEGVKRRELSVK